jgi:hypothetical protein
MAEAKITTDHDEIRRWTEERDGMPATVKATAKKDEAGILRLDFPPRDEALEEISWDEFFDKEKLAFLYQEETEDGSASRFHKFVDRSSAAQGAGGKVSAAKDGARKSAGSGKGTATSKPAMAAKSSSTTSSAHGKSGSSKKTGTGKS